MQSVSYRTQQQRKIMSMINFPLLFSVRLPMLVRGLKASIDMSQKCTKCKITKDESELTQQKKPKEVGLAKSLKSVIYNA